MIWARLINLLATLALAGAALAPAGTALAQDIPVVADKPAILVADRVFVTPDGKLVAEGSVEAFQGNTRLRASRITYDRETETLDIEGPIRIDQGDGVIVLADSAQLDRGLQNGLLSGARMVLDEQVQLAALQMARVGGRYTQLYKTAVTSCQVCANGKPLWQIRARKVIHDQEERQLYFEDAVFLIMDVPVFYLPRFRLPDPTLDRAQGFLIPSVRTTSRLGTGLRLPYFIPLGDSRDLTLSPYISSKTRTLDFRYRQKFRRGQIEFEGAYTRDDLLPGTSRGYLFGSAEFDLARDFKLNLDIEAASDNAYLADYGLPDLDRLQSEITLGRFKRDSAFQIGLIQYTSLRDGEDVSILPTPVSDARYEKRFFPAWIGGEARLGVATHTHQRASELDGAGRDIERATIDLTWRRNWTLQSGLRADWQMGLATDAFRISQDSAYDQDVIRITPSTAFKLSYPMTRTGADGVTQFLEPVVQFGWSNVSGGDLPNDESKFVEFDQGNLLSLSRFPAPDRREDGMTLVYGINWARYGGTPWQASATIGQVLRQTADPSFTRSSGLSGTSSDILVAGQLKLDTGLTLTARSLLDGAFSLSKAELRSDWINERTNISGTYLWLGADPVEGRDRALSELWFDGFYEIFPNWTASANLRYDISDARAARAGIGLVYRTECVTVDLSLNRRYTSSTSVEPSTDFGFTIALNGRAAQGQTKKNRRKCN